MKKIPRIAIDTTVLVSAFRSRRGASYKILSYIGGNLFSLVLSVPVVIEYEDVLKRKEHNINVTQDKICDILDRLCYFGEQREIYFLWRPFLKDPKDDLFLELAVEANCNYIISYNKADFSGIDKFSIQVLTPKEFLIEVGII